MSMNVKVSLPNRFTTESVSDTEGVFVIEGLTPGYGHTIGNSFRRILLSSIPGYAVVKVKIDGVKHEFGKIDGIVEDILNITLNLKSLRFKGDESITTFNAKIDVSSEGPVIGKDVECENGFEVINKDQHICTIAKNGVSFKADLTVIRGMGYLSREMLHDSKPQIGEINLDGFFSPVLHVRYDVEDMRVGSRTDFNRLRIYIKTDGSIKPDEALELAGKIMIEQLVAVLDLKDYENDIDKVPNPNAKMPQGGVLGDKLRQLPEILKTRIDSLAKLSPRVVTALTEANVRTVGGLTQKTEKDILSIPGIGNKGLEEIKDALSDFDLTLKD